MNLSVGIITYNEEKNLSRTLNAVKDIADEIVIVDSGSTDKTPEIAQSYNARFFTEEWKGFGNQKNSVIDKCRGKWILLIDADEEISAPLREKIKAIISGKNNKFKVYKLNFNTFCFGKEIKHGGWSGFYRIRLFLNGTGEYNNHHVHESFITAEPVGEIKEKINHYTYSSLTNYFNKLNEYTSKSAEKYFKAGKKKSILATHVSAAFYFIKTYIFRLGFLDGYEGYLLAKFSASTILIKYAKLRELQKSSQKKLSE